jgi:hypothetical protein
MTALWAGELPLATAFWWYAMIFGTAFNLVTTAAKLLAISAGWPGAAILALAALPLPYILAATVGVMRSADRYEGPRAIAMLAQAGIAAWAIVMIVV